jgi:hypothetical protein
MVGAGVEEVAGSDDDDIAINEEATITVGQGEKTVTMTDNGAGTAGREGDVTMEDDASSSACKSSLSSFFGLSFGSTLGYFLDSSLSSSFGSSSTSSHGLSSVTSVDADMDDAPAVAKTDATSDDSAPAAKEKNMVSRNLLKSFLLSSQAFQTALIEEDEQKLVVKLDGLISQQPWFSTLQFASKGIVGWGSILSIYVQQNCFLQPISRANPASGKTTTT